MYKWNDVLNELNLAQATILRWERLGYVTISKQFDENRKRVFTEKDFKILKSFSERNSK